MSETGKVYLVGAGPGDPGLITVRGQRCIEQADLVLYDGLVNPLLLRHASGCVERTARTSRPGSDRVPQSEVNERMIAAARHGMTVVRLKGGDPFVFGRGGEEAAALTAAGIPFEVVPGITAATAAAVYAGISLTHREHASAVALVTGHEDPTKDESRIDYAVLARFPGTLVFYMGLHHVESITQKLMAAGMPPETPAAVVCRTTLPEQQLVTAPLRDISQAASDAQLQPPSLIVVGPTVAQRDSASWFERRPLHGVSIGLTRSEDQLDGVIERVLELGGDPVAMPLIQIQPPEDWAPVDAVLERISDFDWIVFTSANGVHSFLARLGATGGDARRFASARLAVIGPATAEALAEFHLWADLMPSVFRAEDLAEAMAPQVEGRKVLWVRASRGRDVLPDRLTAAGAVLEQIVAYQNVDAEALSPDVVQRIQTGRLDWIGLSSPSIARSLAQLLSATETRLGGVRLAAISPVTEAAAIECGLPIAAVAETYTWDGLLAAIAGPARTVPSHRPGG